MSGLIKWVGWVSSLLLLGTVHLTCRVEPDYVGLKVSKQGVSAFYPKVMKSHGSVYYRICISIIFLKITTSKEI